VWRLSTVTQLTCKVELRVADVPPTLTHQGLDPHLDTRRLLSLLDVVVDMHMVAELEASPNDIEAHCDDLLAGGAVVTHPDVAFECILQVKQATSQLRNVQAADPMRQM
jgi:hypothetical protein